MTRSIHTPRAVALALCASLGLLLLAPVADVAAATPVFQHESFSAFEKQLAAGEIRSAEFNKKAHSLHLILKSGEYALVNYPSGHEEPAIKAKLEAKSVPVSIEKVKGRAKAKAHHTLRYIAGAIVVIVIVVVTAVLLIDRRRKLAETAAPRPGPPAGADSL
jgi:hypothetical protein